MKEKDVLLYEAEEMNRMINKMIACCKEHWNDDEMIEASEHLAIAQIHIEKWKKEKEKE